MRTSTAGRTGNLGSLAVLVFPGLVELADDIQVPTEDDQDGARYANAIIGAIDRQAETQRSNPPPGKPVAGSSEEPHRSPALGFMSRSRPSSSRCVTRSICSLSSLRHS